MESLTEGIRWLTEHEAALSAVAALVVILGVLLSPIGIGFRRFFVGNPNSASKNEPDTVDSSGTSGMLSTAELSVTPSFHKPSIAVLPFVNMSQDADKEFFADGMTEDIITGLSCDSRLSVVARNSTYTYKGQSADIRMVGSDLGVRYVLEGSIRPVGERFRITLLLSETDTGSNLWAEKIDRPISEIFDVQDEVVEIIVTTLCSNLGIAESIRAQRQRPEDLNAWALCAQAEVLFFTQPDGKTYQKAEALARRATEVEPGYAVSWALLGWMTSSRIVWGLSTNPADDASAAISLVDEALRLAPNDPTVLGYCGIAASWIGEANKGIGYLERSLALNPNNGNAQIALGFALWTDSKPQEGLDQLLRYISRSPKDPSTAMAIFFVSFCHLSLRNYQESEIAARESVKHFSGFAWGYLSIAMSLSAMERDIEAQREMETVYQLEPTWTLKHVEDVWRLQLRDPTSANYMIKLLHAVWTD